MELPIVTLSALVSNERIYLIPINASDLELIEEEMGTGLFEVYEYDYERGNHLRGIPLNSSNLFALLGDFNVNLETIDSNVIRQWAASDPFRQWTEKYA